MVGNRVGNRVGVGESVGVGASVGGGEMVGDTVGVGDAVVVGDGSDVTVAAADGVAVGAVVGGAGATISSVTVAVAVGTAVGAAWFAVGKGGGAALVEVGSGVPVAGSGVGVGITHDHGAVGVAVGIASSSSPGCDAARRVIGRLVGVLLVVGTGVAGTRLASAEGAAPVAVPGKAPLPGSFTKAAVGGGVPVIGAGAIASRDIAPDATVGVGLNGATGPPGDDGLSDPSASVRATG